MKKPQLISLVAFALFGLVLGVTQALACPGESCAECAGKAEGKTAMHHAQKKGGKRKLKCAKCAEGHGEPEAAKPQTEPKAAQTS